MHHERFNKLRQNVSCAMSILTQITILRLSNPNVEKHQRGPQSSTQSHVCANIWKLAVHKVSGYNSGSS